jgi:hypothetical protein
MFTLYLGFMIRNVVNAVNEEREHVVWVR